MIAFHGEDRLSSLRDLIATSVESFSRNQLSSYNNDILIGFSNKIDELCASSTPSDIGNDLEISFRVFLNTLLEKDEMQFLDKIGTLEGNNTPIMKLLKFSLEYSVRKSLLHVNVPKIPFLLIEDLLKALTISSAEKFWSIIEGFSADLTRPEIFAKGQLIVLRICNSLLRKLSKTCNTEFCGRILTFLSSVYPLTEKSALNAVGLVNFGNVTSFESSEEFQTGGGAAPSEESISYDLYSSFWGIQSFFSAELKYLDSMDKWTQLVQSLNTVFDMFDKTAMSSEEIATSRQKYYNLILSLKDMDTSLGAVRMSMVSAEQQQQGGGDVYFGCKYLTSSKLLDLQLRDPMLRQQIGCQILFYMQSLRLKPPAFVIEAEPSNVPTVPLLPTVPSPTPSAPTASKTMISLKKSSTSSSSSSSFQSMVASATDKSKSSVAADAKEKDKEKEVPVVPVLKPIDRLMQDIAAIEDKAYSLIQKTPTGSEFVTTIRRVLRRETKYILWKAGGCLSFEKHASPTSIAAACNASVSRPRPSWMGSKLSGSYKIPRNVSTVLLGKEEEFEKYIDASCKQDSAYKYNLSSNMEEVKQLASALGDDVPTFTKFIADYIEAEDPEAGIEETYHPKHDSLYCWRARRLLAAEKISVLEFMHDGDLAKGLVKMNMLKKPQQPAPSVESVDSVDLDVEATEAVTEEDEMLVATEEEVHAEENEVVAMSIAVEETIVAIDGLGDAEEVNVGVDESTEAVGIDIVIKICDNLNNKEEVECIAAEVCGIEEVVAELDGETKEVEGFNVASSNKSKDRTRGEGEGEGDNDNAAVTSEIGLEEEDAAGVHSPKKMRLT